jgi:antitoxin VapB
MAKVYVAKIFQNGGSQAVRIPAELRFEQPEVYLWKSADTDAICISSNPPSNFANFLALQQALLPQLSRDELESEVRLESHTSLPEFLEAVDGK